MVRSVDGDGRNGSSENSFKLHQKIASTLHTHHHSLLSKPHISFQDSNRYIASLESASLPHLSDSQSGVILVATAETKHFSDANSLPG